MTRRTCTRAFKTKATLEAPIRAYPLRIVERVQKRERQPTQISAWKHEFLDDESEVFDKGEVAGKKSLALPSTTPGASGVGSLTCTGSSTGYYRGR